MNSSIAICYWGMTRSTRFIYKTHYEKLFNVLKEYGITVDIYIHTWKTDKNVFWDKISDIEIDYEEYKLLNPTEYKIENQKDFLDSIDFSDYFYRSVYDTYGDSSTGEWIPELVRNHLYALESQKRVTQMMLSSGKPYTYVMYMRPDVEIYTEFPAICLKTLEPRDCCVLNYEHYEGVNDKFAVMLYEDCQKYSHRIDEIKEFRKTCGRIVSEKYTKYILEKYYNRIHEIDFKLQVIRPK